MTSSPEPLAPLPPALRSIWRLCRLGYRHQPRLMAIAFVLSQLAVVPDALLALWVMLLANGVIQHRPGLVQGAAIGLGLSAAATWLLNVISVRVQRSFRDKVTIALESHVAQLQASIVTIAHQERPEFLDRLAMLRNQIFVLDHMYMSVFATLGWALRLAVTLVLLASVHPALLLLAIFALPTVLAAAWRPDVERQAQERAAPFGRRARQLFTALTTPSPAKEVRLFRIEQRLSDARWDAWRRWYDPIAAARNRSAWWYAGAWAIFGIGYVGAIVFVSTVVQASAGAVLLVLAAGARLSAYVSAALGEIGFLRGFWMDGARRLAWLEDYAAATAASGELAPPSRLARGIRFDRVSFTYPGTSRQVLDDVTLTLPAGGVVAVVGENGAGKTTLVKLLAKMYEPTSGAIFLDDVPLARVDAAAWRTAMGGAFQDFFRFEYPVLTSVGLGDVPRIDDRVAVTAGVGRAGADDVLAKLPQGLDTQLGASWPGGVDASFGQWQKLALARGFMRDRPLLLVLDEPTAALDAETEHALFERYASAARTRDESGRITVLVSHRFSTVRMADLIVVLDGARVVEVGPHDALMAAGGKYAELYSIQASAYA